MMVRLVLFLHLTLIDASWCLEGADNASCTWEDDDALASQVLLQRKASTSKQRQLATTEGKSFIGGHSQKEAPNPPTKLYGTPLAGIASEWQPQDPGENADCSLLMLNAGHYDSAPLLCSTGGYDKCPTTVQCGAPFWSKDFVVHITETTQSSHDVDPKFDVVMLDWDSNNFISDGHVFYNTSSHQSRSALTMESSVLHSPLTEQNYRENEFDFSYGFHNGIMTEQTSYIVSDPRDLYDGELVPFEQREQRALVTSCIGSTVPARDDWLLAFTGKIPTHNLCAVGFNAPEDARLKDHNHSWDFDGMKKFTPDGARDKVRHFRNYKFCVAYENAVEDGYVTEKLYDTLRAGCIPIYKGAPDLRSIWHFANESVLFVDDFNSMDELVQRIQQIGNNKTLFESFFEWRHQPIPLPVMRHLFHGLGNIACRACVRHWRRTRSSDANADSLIEDEEAPDWWSTDVKVPVHDVDTASWKGKTSGKNFEGQ